MRTLSAGLHLFLVLLIAALSILPAVFIFCTVWSIFYLTYPLKFSRKKLEFLLASPYDIWKMLTNYFSGGEANNSVTTRVGYHQTGSDGQLASALSTVIDLILREDGYCFNAWMNRIPPHVVMQPFTFLQSGVGALLLVAMHIVLGVAIHTLMG